MDTRMHLVEAATAALLTARREGRTVPAVDLPDTDAAYAVQARVAQALGWFVGAGGRADDAPRHWKSGGASRESLQTHAPLPPAGVSERLKRSEGSEGPAAPADARAWTFHWRGIEAEVALRLAVDVDAARADTLDVDGARALVDAMAVAIEVVDSRWTEAQAAPPMAKLADLQSHGALVLGDWVAFDAGRDWAAQQLALTIGAAAPLVFTGTHAMGDPAWVLPAWLRHATQGGAVLRAGSVVTTGTWCGLPLAARGEAVHVRFDAIGEVGVQF